MLKLDQKFWNCDDAVNLISIKDLLNFREVPLKDVIFRHLINI